MGNLFDKPMDTPAPTPDAGSPKNDQSNSNAGAKPSDGSKGAGAKSDAGKAGTPLGQSVQNPELSAIQAGAHLLGGDNADSGPVRAITKGSNIVAKVSKHVALAGFIAPYVPAILIGLTVIVLLSSVLLTSVSAVPPVLMSDCDTAQPSSGDGSGNSATTASGAWTTKGTTAYKNAQTIFKLLTQDLGISGAAAAGVMGNIAHESGFDPSAENVSDKGHGLIQWTFGRRAKLVTRAKQAGTSINDLKMQIDYLIDEMKQPTNWVSGMWSDNSLVKFGLSKDPQEAAMRFYVSQMEAGGGWSRDPDGTGPKRKANAQKVYELFDGGNISANNSILGSAAMGASGGAITSAGATSSDDNDNCNNDDDDTDTNDIVKLAQKLLGFFKYEQKHGVSYIGSIQNPDRDGVTDCSGFVWLVLSQAGYKVPNNMGWYTGSMEADATGDQKYLKEIDKKQARPGDIVIVNTGSGSGNNGHTAILTSEWKNGDAEIIQMGGLDSSHGVSTGVVSTSFASLLNDDESNLVFVRAIKN